MPEESKHLISRTCQGKHNGTAVLTYERCTEQLCWKQISPRMKYPVTVGFLFYAFIANTIYTLILAKFVLLLPCSKGVKDIGYLSAYQWLE